MKRKLLESALIKARVMAREAIERHKREFMTREEEIQKQMMEMQNGSQTSEPQEQPAGNQPVQTPEG